MTAPIPGSWPVPLPEKARDEALRMVAALIAAGAIDEYTPAHALDPIVDSWVAVWKVWARDGLLRSIVEEESLAKFYRESLGVIEDRIGIERERLMSPPQSAEEPVPDSAKAAAGGTTDAAPSRTPRPGYAGMTIDDDDVELAQASRLAQWWHRGGHWLLLAVLVGADGYGFWQTLDRILQKDTAQLAFFVGALAIGAVATAHQVGRLSRRYVDGNSPDAVPWIGVLSVVWLGLGAVMFWVRAHQPTGTVVDASAAGTGGIFDQATATSAASGAPPQPWASTWGFALLLLLLYAASGTYAMTHAHRLEGRQSARFTHWWSELGLHVDQRTDLIAHLHRTERELARHEKELAEQAFESECEAAGVVVKDAIRAHIALRLGDPSSTSAVMDDQEEDDQPGAPEADGE